MTRRSSIKLISVCTLCLFFILLILIGCQKEQGPPARLHVSGYTARLIHEELFDVDLSNWRLEGRGTGSITNDGRFLITQKDSSEGVMAWLDREFSGSFLLEYEVEIPDTNGVNITHICAALKSDQDFFSTRRTGKQQDYNQSDMMSYQVAYHCYTPDGQHDNNSRLRKNPGSLLLSRTSYDPCIQNRFYLIHIIKTGNRIQFFVDKEKVHDIRDKGGFGNALVKGRIGFWTHGVPHNFSTLIDNLRVYNLIPE